MARVQVHCSVCHEQFASYGVANLHWGSGKSNKAPAYSAQHLDPATVPALAQDEKGVWHMAAKRPADLPGSTTEPLEGVA